MNENERKDELSMDDLEQVQGGIVCLNKPRRIEGNYLPTRRGKKKDEKIDLSIITGKDIEEV